MNGAQLVEAALVDGDGKWNIDLSGADGRIACANTMNLYGLVAFVGIKSCSFVLQVGGRVCSIERRRYGSVGDCLDSVRHGREVALKLNRAHAHGRRGNGKVHGRYFARAC
jgi:hypothetical protein